MSQSLSENLVRLQRVAFTLGGVGAALCGAGLAADAKRFYEAWLVAFLFWLAPALGSMAIVMLHNMTGGGWGFAVRRLLEAAMRTVPWMALFFVPVLLGMHELYEWSHADAVATDPLLAHKALYLNARFFSVRALVYFALWAGLARGIVRLSERYDRKLSTKALRRLKVASGFGLAGYVLTLTFASFDWGMSLEPHWYSTIYGLQFVVGQALATLCVAIVVASRLARHEPFSRWLSPGHFHDLGNLTMAFVLLWAYLAFSQYLIIWSGNLPEETPFYVARLGHGWQALALLLLVGHFAAPFAILLVRQTKRDPRVLAAIAVVLLGMRYVDLYWMLAPAFRAGFAPHWIDLAAMVALGGLWIGLFVRSLRGRPLVSLQDSRLLGQLEGVA